MQFIERQVLTGRLLCDTLVSAKVIFFYSLKDTHTNNIYIYIFIYIYVYVYITNHVFI